MGGGGSSLPEDSAGYLYNDGSGNLSYDEAPTPEPAGSDMQIQFNDGGVMAGSSALTFDKTKKTLSLTNAITDFSSSALYGRCCDQQATALASSYQAPIASLGSSSKSIRILDGNQQSFASITGDSISIYDYCNFENKKAQGYISGSTSNVAAGQTVTIGSTVYTFATTPTVEGDVAVGADVTASLQNLYAAINGTGTLGVEHYCTSAHPDVTASAFNSTQKRILLEAKTAGAAGESITLAESSALSKSGSTLVRPADWLATYLLRLSMDSDGSYGTQVKHGNVTGINAVLAMSGFNGTMYCNPVGYSVQISSAVTDALAYDRGTMIFFQGSADIFGGHYTDIFGFKAEMISVSSYGSADDVYCFYAATPAVNASSGAFVTNAYGLYVEDFTSSGATNVYGLYIAGATQNNYIAGNLEVAGTLTVNLAAMGLDPSLATLTLPDNVTVSDFIKTLLDDTDAATARATLGVPDASESAKGIAEIATQTEVDAGTDDARIVTPAKLYATPGIYRKNAIINGDMMVWQRGTSFAASADGAFHADRWSHIAATDAVVTVSRSTNVPTDAQGEGRFAASLQVDVTTADASIGSGQAHAIRYKVEGYDIRSFVGQVCTLSFWVAATKPGIYCINLLCAGADRSYVKEYTINSANTWEKKTITFTLDASSGTWDFTNGVGLQIRWTLAAGSNYRVATDGVWGTALYATANQVNGLDSTDNYFLLTGVQLEKGSVATPFEFRSFASELALCERYYQKSYYMADGPGAVTTNDEEVWHASVTGAQYYRFQYRSRMRTAPTLTVYSTATGTANRIRDWSATSDITPSSTFGWESAGYVEFTGTSGHLMTFQWVTSAEL